MTNGVTAEVEGLTTFRASLAAAGQSLDHLDGSEAGRIVSLRASSNAPKATGALARSIQADEADQEVTVSSSLDYAAVTEFGGGNNISAQPYMRPALLDSQDAVTAAYAREVDQAVGMVRGT